MEYIIFKICNMLRDLFWLLSRCQQVRC